jgi:ribosomal protein S13
MRKINYPKSINIIKAFKVEYKEQILGSNLLKLKEANELLNSIGVKFSFEEILVLPIEELIKLPEINSTNLFNGLNKIQVKIEKDRIKKIFNYTGFQSNILSGFFMKHGKSLKIKTCCYCNIDFVNPYIPFSNDYIDYYHFINSCTKTDLLKIKGIGSKSADDIISKYKGKIKKYDDIENLINDTRIKNILKKLTDHSGILKTNDFLIQNKNHFTLDHVLPQNLYPYLSLSLFNLTPSCYSCNSKLKRDAKIYSNNSDIKSISPTGIDSVFDLNFKIYFKDGFDKNNLPDTSNEYSIKIDSPHKEYIERLNLQGRYNFHKDISFDLIDKRKIYSDSQIQEIVSLFEEKKIRINEIQLKKQIFGSVIFEEDSNEQLEKYKKDIAKQLEII